METTIKFSNPPYTTPEQSKKLLELGVSKYTADLYCTVLECGFSETKIIPETFCFDGDDIPQWSLSRLLEMVTSSTESVKVIGSNRLVDTIPGEDFFKKDGNIFDSLIELIEFQILEDYFCPRYLGHKYVTWEEDLVYYDGVQVFSAQDTACNYYIGVLQPDNLTYLLSKVSYTGLTDFKSGIKDLREVLTSSHCFYKLYNQDIESGKELPIYRINECEVTDDMLPEEGFYID